MGSCITDKANGIRANRFPAGRWDFTGARTASRSGAIPQLVADETSLGKLSACDARAFIRRLAERLEVNPGHALPGYEDAWYYLWKERRLPGERRSVGQ